MIYLDNGATSFKKPESVLRAVCEATYKNSANPGRGGHNLSVAAGETVYGARESLAKLFNIEKPERIAFCKNTTEALNYGIKGVMSRGGHVITTSMEHNSVIRPIKALEKEKGVAYSILNADENGNLDVEKLIKLIKPETRLFVMTHSSNVCGNVYDIRRASEICKRKNILFMVDAAQSAGSVEIDAGIVDLLAFPGHKGLMGPMGTGGLYVKEGVKISPIIEGGTGSLSESLLQPDFFPDMLESGTLNVPGIAGLAAAADFIQKVGAEEIGTYEKTLLMRFEERLKNMNGVKMYGGEARHNICAMNIDGADCVEVANILNDRYGICVRAGLHCAILAHKSLKTEKAGCVRFSFGYFNTIKEVDFAADSVYNLSKDLQLWRN